MEAASVVSAGGMSLASTSTTTTTTTSALGVGLGLAMTIGFGMTPTSINAIVNSAPGSPRRRNFNAGFANNAALAAKSQRALHQPPAVPLVAKTSPVANGPRNVSGRFVNPHSIRSTSKNGAPRVYSASTSPLSKEYRANSVEDMEMPSVNIMKADGKKPLTLDAQDSQATLLSQGSNEELLNRVESAAAMDLPSLQNMSASNLEAMIAPTAEALVSSNAAAVGRLFEEDEEEDEEEESIREDFVMDIADAIDFTGGRREFESAADAEFPDPSTPSLSDCEFGDTTRAAAAGFWDNDTQDENLAEDVFFGVSPANSYERGVVNLEAALNFVDREAIKMEKKNGGAVDNKRLEIQRWLDRVSPSTSIEDIAHEEDEEKEEDKEVGATIVEDTIVDIVDKFSEGKDEQEELDVEVEPVEEGSSNVDSLSTIAVTKKVAVPAEVLEQVKIPEIIIEAEADNEVVEDQFNRGSDHDEGNEEQQQVQEAPEPVVEKNTYNDEIAGELEAYLARKLLQMEVERTPISTIAESGYPVYPTQQGMLSEIEIPVELNPDNRVRENHMNRRFGSSHSLLSDYDDDVEAVVIEDATTSVDEEVDDENTPLLGTQEQQDYSNFLGLEYLSSLFKLGTDWVLAMPCFPQSEKDDEQEEKLLYGDDF